MTTKPKPKPDEVSDEDRAKLNAGRCPECGGRGFVLGPRGGMNQNIECAQVTCRARFNVAIFAGAIQHAQRIEKRVEGGPRWLSEPVQ